MPESPSPSASDTVSAPPFNYARIFVLGFGFLGISLLWAIYDDFVPILLQAGRPDFTKGAGVKGFGLGTTMTGFVMGLDNFAAVFILPYIGGISDRIRTRWGRRKPFVMIGAPIGAAAFTLVPFLLKMPLPVFMGALIITLLAMDLFRTPVVALMGDLTPPALRSPSNGIINFMGGLGGVIAAQIGGRLFGISPIAPFLLGAGGMLIAQAILLLAIKEPNPEERHPEEAPDEEVSLGLLPSLLKVLRDKDPSAVLVLGAILFWFLGQSAFGTWFTSYVMQQLGLKTADAVVLKGTFTTAVLLGALPAGWVGGQLGRRRTILLGIGLMALSIAGCYFAPTAGVMGPLLFVAGVSWMLIGVNSLPLVLDFAPAGRSGTYTGLYYLASQTASFLGPIISGRMFEVADNNYRVLCVYTPLMLLIAGGLIFGVRGGNQGKLAAKRAQAAR